MDGKTGSTIVGDRIEDQPGEGVVALQHVSEIGIVKNNASEVGSVSRWRTRNHDGRTELSDLSTSVVKLLSRECLLWPGPGPRPSSPPCARLAMLMCRADLRKTGQTDSK